MTSAFHHRAWTPERDEQFKALAADHKSASYAAEIMGVTRSAAIGRASRIGLSFHGHLSRQLAFTPRPSRPRTPPKPIDPIPDDAPVSLGLTIEALSDKVCRYPYGTASPYSFCGAGVASGSIYCGFHKAICIAPAKTSAV